MKRECSLEQYLSMTPPACFSPSKQSVATVWAFSNFQGSAGRVQGENNWNDFRRKLYLLGRICCNTYRNAWKRDTAIMFDLRFFHFVGSQGLLEVSWRHLESRYQTQIEKIICSVLFGDLFPTMLVPNSDLCAFVCVCVSVFVFWHRFSVSLWRRPKGCSSHCGVHFEVSLHSLLQMLQNSKTATIGLGHREPPCFCVFRSHCGDPEWHQKITWAAGPSKKYWFGSGVTAYQQFPWRNRLGLRAETQDLRQAAQPGSLVAPLGGGRRIVSLFLIVFFVILIHQTAPKRQWPRLTTLFWVTNQSGGGSDGCHVRPCKSVFQMVETRFSCLLFDQWWCSLCYLVSLRFYFDGALLWRNCRGCVQNKPDLDLRTFENWKNDEFSLNMKH